MKTILLSNSPFGEIILKKLIDQKSKPSLLITFSDKKSGRGQQEKSLSIKDFAINQGIETKEADTKEEVHEIIAKEKPDVVVVTAFGIIIPKETLDLSFFINIHPSLLPKYRGATPIQSAIIEGTQKTGVSIIKMNEKIDEGPIIIQKEALLDQNINYKKAEEFLAHIAGDLLIKTLSLIKENKVEFKDQSKEATYTKTFKKEDGKITWNKPAEVIKRKVRALNPWPGTYCYLNDKVFKILEADIQEQTNSGPFGQCGKIYLGTNYTIAVQTGKDFLLVKKLQIEGKPPTSSKDFLQGNIDLIGSILE